VTAQLIRVNDETHTWAREYDRELTGLLAVQGEIAREISDEIQVALGDRPAKRSAEHASIPVQQSEAYDFYLKGLYFWNRRTADDFRRAIDYFQQAIAKDPAHGPSYAGLADCYALLDGYTGEVRPEYMIQARSTALRALEIDPNLPEAHTALAVIVQNYDRDWQTAGNEYRRAIELNPSYAMAHQWYGEHLGYLGKFEEAFRESERARQLDPLSLIISTDNAMLLYYSRQYDRAIEKFRAVLEMDSNFPRAHSMYLPYLRKGLFAEALAQVEPLERSEKDQPYLWSELAQIYGLSGRRQQALRALENLKQLYRSQETDPAMLVTAYLGLGNQEQAFAWLEKAYAQHSNMMTTLKVDPLFDPLRGDPRFQDLLRRVGLTPQ
jgi:tetratricopeptide (TPR) repeat protein